MTSTKGFKLDASQLEYIFNHVFLPPNVPQQDDYQDSAEKVLLRVVGHAINQFKNHVSHDMALVIEQVGNMIDRLSRLLDRDGITNGERLQDALANLGTEGGVLLLHIRAQNCGILMSRVENSIGIEAFEVSPLNTSVISTLGRLRRTFPGPALSMSLEKFKNSDFQVAVAETLAKMSHQTAPNTKPQVRKKGVLLDEEWDTTHPKVVTELFFNFLRPQCTETKPFTIVKNTREEVMWNNAYQPWHRSSLWLLVRVGMQLVLSRSSKESSMRNETYKVFMLFLLSTVLDLSCQAGGSCEMIYAMQAKICRRLLKLDSLGKSMKLDYIERIMQKSSAYLQSKWDSIISDCEPKISLRLGESNPTLDTIHNLPEVDDFIQELSQLRSNQTTKCLFSPPSKLAKFYESHIPSLDRIAEDDYIVYNLKAFESWVEKSLNIWVSNHMNEKTACGKLSKLVCRYHELAAPLYAENPEATSEMLLIITELWIACDRCTISIDDTIRQYDVGVPDQLFQCFILRSRPQMQRLYEAENYIRSRRDEAYHKPSETFQGFGNSNCYSVKYFNQSDELQNLKRDIEAHAEQEKTLKIQEFHEKKELYKKLMREYEGSSHDQEEVVVNYYQDIRENRCKSYCRKCVCLREAKSMKIYIHEWPLPAEDMEAKSVVFELRVPQWYGYWRDTAMYLLHDVYRMNYRTESKPQAMYKPSDYTGLRSYFKAYSPDQRLSLLSEVKPHTNTHRKQRSIVDVTTEFEICLQNALHYHYFDNRRGIFISEFHIETDHIPPSCIYVLPQKSSALQEYLRRPASAPNGPPPNKIIAHQCDCPQDMQLEEYKALAQLPLGVRIQWQNILVQLAIPAVNFKKCETTLFILQAIYQAGPRTGNILREGHQVTDDENFTWTFLRRIQDMTISIQENWEGYQALNTLTSLTVRVVSLNSNVEIQEEGLRILQRLRSVACLWIGVLKEKVQESTSDQRRKELSEKSVLLSLICVSSFSVDQDHLQSILSNSEDLSILIQNSITIEEGRNCITSSMDPLALVLHLSWKQLLFRARLIIIENINGVTSVALNHAIRRSWSAYNQDTDWKTASKEEYDWIFTMTTSQGGVKALPVHYNILTGELLVDGDRLSSLPPKYEQHSTYGILFGRSSLEIMPSGISGMRYSTKKTYAGHTVHFGISGENTVEYDLRIRAVNPDKTLELVPSRLLYGKLPSAFIESFVHWYDCATRQIEFRPINNAWQPSSEAWLLAQTAHGQSWQLTRGESSLMNMKSLKVREISQILAPLELPHRLHVSLKSLTSTIEIDLPCLDLGFQIERGSQEIRSREFRGFLIDEDQSLGSLINFKNKLVLTHEKQESQLALLLGGSLRTQKSGDHVTVQVKQEGKARAYAFQIDPWLGRLVDSGNLQSKLFLCLVHALTSFCLPDPLTKKTGTEQAISILNSASLHSFDSLSEENLCTLHEIAHLAPERRYYPQNAKEMQTVIWRPELGFLAQDGALFKAVQSLIDEKVRQKFLWPESCQKLPDFNFVQSELLTRDLIRSSSFRVSGFGAELHTTSHDRDYHGRDRGQASEPGWRVFVTADLIYHERQEIYHDLQGNITSHMWNFLSEAPTIHCSDGSFPAFEFEYDSQLLIDPYQAIRSHWLSLHGILRNKPPVDKFRFTLCLSALSFGEQKEQKEQNNMLVIQTLILFYISQKMTNIQLPSSPTYDLSKGYEYKMGVIGSIIESSCHQIYYSPEGNMTKRVDESNNSFQVRQKILFRDNKSRAVSFLASLLRDMWPTRTPSIDENPEFVTNYIDVGAAMKSVSIKFRVWLDNLSFYQYLAEIMQVLACCPRYTPAIPWNSRGESSSLQQRNGRYITMTDILSQPAPELPNVMENVPSPIPRKASSHSSTESLNRLIKNLAHGAESRYEKGYISYLQKSLEMLQKNSTNETLWLKEQGLFQTLQQNLVLHREHVATCFEVIFSAVAQKYGGSNPRKKWMQVIMHAGHGPRLSPSLILEQLNKRVWSSLPPPWKKTVVEYGLALSAMQRAGKIFECKESQRELIKEIQNGGHENWDPHQYPDSLLLEVESDIRIRKVQEEIAREMRHRPARANVVMQLNMGEGKSSVIVPIVAAALADGSRLVRVIVSKPQSKQMFEMLLLKLSGMLGRRIYRLPFSRALKISSAEAEFILEMCQECMRTNGVLLVQPEQILSLKLMCLECLITGKTDVAKSLLKTQRLFDQYARDIVDESDENFSVKFELIYTMGDQKPIQLSPERWTVVHKILDMVRQESPAVKRVFPLVEIGSCPDGGFPRTRIAHTDAQQELVFRIARTICRQGMVGLPIARQGKTVRDSIWTYITKWELDDQEIQAVENESLGFWGESTQDILLLLRGILAGGVLSFALGSKRWRVNYGPNKSRIPPTKLAVPYRAKDNPTARSEFSHPDVVMVFTSLSYYYSGLDDDDLFDAFQHLLKGDQSDAEYQIWVKDADRLPEAFRQLVGVNLQDRYLCVEKLFPPFRFAKSVIDYFLSHLVFSKEMREFPHKLSASGWDIGQLTGQPTTGFSGTNDSRQHLPIDVKQLDLPEQTHTNALVLNYLLQPENGVVEVQLADGNETSNAETFLTLVMKLSPPVQVILDVGAQVLELSNVDVAREWLNRSSSQTVLPQGVVFFDDDDNLCVVDRKGQVELLQTSPLGKHLDVCYIFLDEAHTRGTDLRLPDFYRAAVTLGAGITKDRLVQACMRMRKLGNGQSVVFCVPEDIQHQIRERTNETSLQKITLSDVLTWAIHGTWDDAKKSMPLWATQGERFVRQKRLWDNLCTEDDDAAESSEQARKFLEDEAQSLEQRYRPGWKKSSPDLSFEVQGDVYSEILARCNEFDNISHRTAKMNEEQERELSPEIQHERQVQRPPKETPEKHSIDPDLRTFISTGKLLRNSSAFRPAFQSLRETSAAHHLDVAEFPFDLLVTIDFCRTVRPQDKWSFVSDAYQRSVQWILTGRDGCIQSDTVNVTSQMLIISPFEAQELYELIENSKYVTMHLYGPRSNLGKPALDKLELYNISKVGCIGFDIPQTLTIQLNLFAGQLYFGCYEEYVNACELLGIASEPREDVRVGSDGFIFSDNQTSTFHHSPVKFLKVLMSKIRRNGEGIDRTHMGQLCNGMFLEASDFISSLDISAETGQSLVLRSKSTPL